jgi:hypothetical protein
MVGSQLMHRAAVSHFSVRQSVLDGLGMDALGLGD